MMTKKRTAAIAWMLSSLLVMTSAVSAPAFADTISGSGSDTSAAGVDLNSKAEAQSHTVKYSKAENCTVPITIPSAGTFLIDLKGDYQQAEVKVIDEQGELLGIGRLSANAADKTIYAKADKAGTYGLVFSTDSSKTASTSFCVYYAPAADTQLPIDKIYYASGAAANYRFTAPSMGYLVLEAAESINLNPTVAVKLLDDNMNDMMEDIYFTSAPNGKTYVAVEKGTNYLQISSPEQVYGLKASFTPVKAASSTRSKAQILKKGVRKTAVTTAVKPPVPDKWYKFTLKKAQTVKFSLYKRNNKRVIAFRFYRQGAKKSFLFKDVRNASLKSEFYVSPGDTVKKLPAGTYYVQVMDRGNGFFHLEWIS